MLYGRASEQAAIRELIDAVCAGRSGSLVLRGEPGIGKSALLAWACREAAAGDPLRTLRVTGFELGERRLAARVLVERSAHADPDSAVS